MEPKDVSSVCGSGPWILYKDEKCLQLLPEFVSQDEAQRLCDQTTAFASPNSLLTIQSAEEQEIIQNILFEQLGIVDQVWLGIRRQISNSSSNNETTLEEFKWRDGSPLTFSNWAEGSPSDDEHKTCALITSGLYVRGGESEVMEGNSIHGQWMDSSCEKRAMVLCQKPQVWQMSQIQETLVALRKEVTKNPGNFRKFIYWILEN